MHARPTLWLWYRGTESLSNFQNFVSEKWDKLHYLVDRSPGAPDTGGVFSLSPVKKIRHVHCYCFWQWFQRSGTALHFSVLNYRCTVSLYRCYNEPGDLFTTCVQLLNTFLSIFNKQGISLHPTKLPIISFFCLISLMHDVCLFLFRDYFYLSWSNAVQLC